MVTTVAYSPHWERRALQERILPMIHGVAERHRPVLEEFVVEVLAPLAALEPAHMPSGPPVPCSICWQQRVVWEVGVLGLVPLKCERCAGSGWEPR
jgi:hypothetical protein